MKDGGAERAIGAALGQTFVNVLQGSHATRRDHGNTHGIGDGARESEVVASPCAVTIHARQQNLSCAEVHDTFGPRDRVEPRIGASPMGEHVPAWRIVCPGTLGIDGDDDRLRAPTGGCAFDESGIADGGCIDGDLVGTCIEQRFDVTFAFHATTDGEGSEDTVCRCTHHVEQRAASFVGGRDVEERDLVSASGVVALGHLDGVPRITQRDELHAFDDAPVFDIEAGNDALCEHSSRIAPMSIAGQILRRHAWPSSTASVSLTRWANGETLPNGAQAGSMRRVHCPECGTKANPGAAACAACGQPLPNEVGQRSNLFAAQTMVGVATPGVAAPPIPEPPPEDLPTLIKEPKKPAQPESRARVSSQLQHTLLGGVAPAELKTDASPPDANKQPRGVDGTLLGVARPGNVPIRAVDPGAPREMPHELGATLVPQPVRPQRKANRIGAERLDPDALLINRDKLARKRVVLPPVRSREEQARLEAQQRRRKAIRIIAAALGLLVVAVIVGIVVRSPASLSARVRVMADGHEAVEIDCATCPDGTKVAIGDSSAVISGRLAQIPLVAPLALGENRVKVVVDRPRGSDETVSVSVLVGYRLRPDLSKLSADKPTIHVAIEALKGTEITLEGQTLKLEDGPKAHAIDVSADCTGSSDEAATLRRRIPYSARLPDGTRDEGAVDIAVGIVPLRIDAPGPRVVTDSDTFVLSGHAMKGAEVLVAGRPIQIGADGAFAQRMSVSSIGATNIEVRAKFPGMAPRIVPIAVQRVERLEQAAKDFQKEQPVGYTTVALASNSDVGRPVIVAGQIAEVRTQNHQTIYVLDVPSREGCPKVNEACRVRLVHGAAPSAKVGDSITAFGQIGRPSATPGGAVVPEVQVAFTLPAATRASP